MASEITRTTIDCCNRPVKPLLFFAMSSSNSKAKQLKLKAREEAFSTNMNTLVNEKLPKYNALHDGNLRHFFENRKIQNHLYQTGLVGVESILVNS
jgi:hypothetical protein